MKNAPVRWPEQRPAVSKGYFACSVGDRITKYRNDKSGHRLRFVQDPERDLFACEELADFTGASFDEDAVRAMKEAAVFDKPYIKKTAWVGAQSLPEVFSESLKSFARRDFPAFETREEALAWLASDWLRI